MSSKGWNCSKCTYYHSAPGRRCVMCNELRITKQHMADFVQGKPIPEDARPPSKTPVAILEQAKQESIPDKRPVLRRPTGNRTIDSFFRPQAKVAKTSNPNPASSRRETDPPALSLSQLSTKRSATGSKTVSMKRVGPAGMARGVLESSAPTSTSSQASAPQRSQQYSAVGRQQATGATVERAGSSSSMPSSKSSKNPYLSRPRGMASSSATAATRLQQKTTAFGAKTGETRSDPIKRNVGNPYDKRGPKVPAGTSKRAPEHSALTSASIYADPGPQHRRQQQQAISAIPRPTRNSTKPLTPSTALPENHTNAFDRMMTTTRHPDFKHVPYVPGPVPLDPTTCSTWIYPVHDDFPRRQYQFEITQSALFSNTLVSLPTGLGKTHIAAVTLYNFYRWFPTGKVLFLAPTLPLVNQQVEACYNIMGIPASDTALLTGKIAADKRSDLWQERRVFFCTPQTVQKDLMSGICPAQRVSCVVLDEAHKACGDYAYTKVVEYLEQAGAHFRIVGLSATPGANIKAVQKVITALRIHKVQARRDDHPSVKPYVHNRAMEIAFVKRADIVKNIEDKLNHIIEPMMEILRQRGAFGNRHVTTKNAQPFTIVDASQRYASRTDKDPSVSGYFHAVHTFVSIRNDLQTLGIGQARTKLQQLREGRLSGKLSSVVKGNDFEEVWQDVLQATSEENKKLNNPKLEKLEEVLEEHFARARLNEEAESSRAIVFSQSRDSVSEIVSVLGQSTVLRPRHFVGQSNATSRRNNNKNADQEYTKSLPGMNQKEQQRVIQEFREGKYNVLVCTCIGEEGLDIGQVDLIVCFDTLKSPIRTLQRIGRTGRKRDGRVISLISEGVEQRAYNAQKASEKTLSAALDNPSGFDRFPNKPMFPTQPTLQEQKMAISTCFHMSQVGGLAKIPKDTISAASKRPKPRNWRLTEEQEERRSKILGEVQGYLANSSNFPLPLRKRLLRARHLCCQTTHRKEKSGVAVNLLREFEARNQSSSSRLAKASCIRSSRRDCQVLRSLFPLEKVDSTSSNLSISAYRTTEHQSDSTLSVDNRKNPTQRTAEPGAHTGESILRAKSNRNHESTVSARSFAPQERQESIKAHQPTEDRLLLQVPSETDERSLPRTAAGAISTRNPLTSSDVFRPREAATCSDAKLLGQGCMGVDEELPSRKSPLGSSTSKNSYQADNTTDVDTPPRATIRSNSTSYGQAGTFLLPTPPSSSSSESDSEDSRTSFREILPPAQADTALEEAEYTSTHVAHLQPTSGNANSPRPDCQLMHDEAEGRDSSVLRLPTQDSSSSEEESDDERGHHDTLKQPARCRSEESLCETVKDAREAISSTSFRTDCDSRCLSPVTKCNLDKGGAPAMNVANANRTDTAPTGQDARKADCQDQSATKDYMDSTDEQAPPLSPIFPPKRPSERKATTVVEKEESSGEDAPLVTLRRKKRKNRGASRSKRLRTRASASEATGVSDNSSGDCSAAEVSADADIAGPPPDQGETSAKQEWASPGICTHQNTQLGRTEVCKSGDTTPVEGSAAEIDARTVHSQNQCTNKDSTDSACKQATAFSTLSLEHTSGKATTDMNIASEEDSRCDDAPIISLRRKKSKHDETPLPKRSKNTATAYDIHNKNDGSSQCSSTYKARSLPIAGSNPSGNNETCVLLNGAGTESKKTEISLSSCLQGTPVSTAKASWGDFSPDVEEESFPPANHRRKKRTQHVLLSCQDSETEYLPKTPNLELPVQSPHGLVDTPSTVLAEKCMNSSSPKELVDTPLASLAEKCTSFNLSADDIVCAICLCGDSPDDNPIVLCDGAGGARCDLAVHQDCYGIKGDLELLETWRCDPCSIGSNRAVCLVCQNAGGPLKKETGNDFVHPCCKEWKSSRPNMSCDICGKNKAVQCAGKGCATAVHPHCAIVQKTDVGVRSWALVRLAAPGGQPDAGPGPSLLCPEHVEGISQIATENGCYPVTFTTKIPRIVSFKTALPQSSTKGIKKRLRKKIKPSRDSNTLKSTPSPPQHSEAQCASGSASDTEERSRRRRFYRNRVERAFIDAEARIDSDEDMDGDEIENAEIGAIEEEEGSINDFINDSSQLSVSQDELDGIERQINGEVAAVGDFFHRKLDNERERAREFATPLLNRMMLRGRGEESARTPYSGSTPGSEQGLGNMHFIRSVLEHHRNGGRAEEIETFFNNMEETTPTSAATPQNDVDTTGPEAFEVLSIDSDATGNSRQAEAKRENPGNASRSSSLTEEQRARIEANRQAALRRLQQRQASSLLR